MSHKSRREFQGWWMENSCIDYEAMCAAHDAWHHQQKKIDKLEKQLLEAKDSKTAGVNDMADKITRLIPQNSADNPDLVLHQAEGVYKDVLILGWRHDDETLDPRASSGLKERDILWLIEQFKADLLNDNC